eukprot:3144148-Lingulodinium_polyedra.AAC.1
MAPRQRAEEHGPGRGPAAGPSLGTMAKGRRSACSDALDAEEGLLLAARRRPGARRPAPRCRGPGRRTRGSPAQHGLPPA